MSADFKKGDKVLVTDPGLAQLRAIMRDATGKEPEPNHHGVVEEVWDDGNILIHFEDGTGSPWPPSMVRLRKEEGSDAR